MSFDHIISLLISYRYFLLFPISVIEGPIITIIAGFLSSIGKLNIIFAYIIVVAGDLVGDVILYAFGYYGGYKFIEKWGKFFGVTKRHVEKLERHFSMHSGKTLVIGKLTHAVGSLVLFSGGLAKMSFWRFVWYNFIATLPKSLALILIGFYFGRSYVKISNYLDYTAIGSVMVLVIFIGLYFMMRNMGKKYDEDIN